MMCMEKNNIYMYYDAKHDDLTVKDSERFNDVYSEEIYDNVYAYVNDNTDEIVGAQILDFSQRNIEKLKDCFPDHIYESIKNKYYEIKN